MKTVFQSRKININKKPLSGDFYDTQLNQCLALALVGRAGSICNLILAFADKGLRF